MIYPATRKAIGEALRVGRRGGGPTTISGFAYPGETLTSTGAGQWYVDDVAIIGQTGSTFVVRLDDIGKPIRQANSNVLVVWSPLDMSPALWLSDTGSNTAQWDDLSGNGRHATQAIGANQPAIIAGAINGRQVRRFDGVNDWMEVPFFSSSYIRVYAVNQRLTGSTSSYNYHRAFSYGNLVSSANDYLSGVAVILTDASTAFTVIPPRISGGTRTSPVGNTIYIGRAVTTSLASLTNSDLVEILVFTTNYGTDELNKITGYLKLKYNIP